MALAQDPWILGWTFVIGAMIGSFLNVVGLRLLREEEFINKGSYCYHCQSPIAWYDNIPIASWLALMGRCRHCKLTLSVQYPLVELATGLLLMALLYSHGFTIQTLLLAFLLFNLIVIMITDLREQYIYDVNSLSLIPVGLIYAGLTPGVYGPMGDISLLGVALPAAMVSSLIAVVGAFLVFFTLNLISRLLVGTIGFGEGDVRMLMGIGAFFGWPWMLWVFITGFLIQAALGIPYMLWQWWRQRAFRVIGLTTGGFMCAFVPYTLQWIWPDTTMMLLTALLFGGCAMLFAMKGLRAAKALPNGLTYLPFGPALALATMLIVFFHAPIANHFAWLRPY